MGTTSTKAAVWGMLAARWRKTIKAKNLSANTERDYVFDAQQWAEWLSEQELDFEPDRVKPHHADDFIADIIGATSAANGAYHYRNLRVFFGWLVKREVEGGRGPVATVQRKHPQRADDDVFNRSDGMASEHARGTRRQGQGGT
jgi:site-specific recombinase XerD